MITRISRSARDRIGFLFCRAFHRASRARVAWSVSIVGRFSSDPARYYLLLFLILIEQLACSVDRCRSAASCQRIAFSACTERVLDCTLLVVSEFCVAAPASSTYLRNIPETRCKPLSDDRTEQRIGLDVFTLSLKQCADRTRFASCNYMQTCTTDAQKPAFCSCHSWRKCQFSCKIVFT